MIGCQGCHVEKFETRPSDRQLSDIAWEFALEHASSYGSVFYSADEEDYEEDDPRCFLTQDIDGWFEEYNPEEHDDVLYPEQVDYLNG
jgi:hypothetical protein